VVRVPDRPAFQQRLFDCGVHTAIHYPIAPHHQQAYAKDLGHMKLPLTEVLHREVVSLPVSPVMTDEQVGYVIGKLNKS
jgi:dTDP-4-amino-4,6-dideoxygalactose transaminase